MEERSTQAVEVYRECGRQKVPLPLYRECGRQKVPLPPRGGKWPISQGLEGMTESLHQRDPKHGLVFRYFLDFLVPGGLNSMGPLVGARVYAGWAKAVHEGIYLCMSDQGAEWYSVMNNRLLG